MLILFLNNTLLKCEIVMQIKNIILIFTEGGLQLLMLDSGSVNPVINYIYWYVFNVS
jgi:hypothetical protein